MVWKPAQHLNHVHYPLIAEGIRFAVWVRVYFVHMRVNVTGGVFFCKSATKLVIASLDAFSNTLIAPPLLFYSRGDHVKPTFEIV